MAGVPVVLADTAGLRETHDEIEHEGVRRALRRAESADILIAVFATGVEPDQATLRLAETRPDALIVVTKCDQAGVANPAVEGALIRTSIRTGVGLAELKAALEAQVERRAALSDAPVLTRARHRAALEMAKRHLETAANIARSELVAEEFRAAELALGGLTGRGGVEAILDIVFNDFCIGK